MNHPGTIDLRNSIHKKRTTMMGDLVVDKVSGEILGRYIMCEYTPAPCDYPAPTNKYELRYLPDSDGTPPLVCTTNLRAEYAASATVTNFPKHVSRENKKSTAGRKAQFIENPFFAVISVIRFEDVPAAWLDDYVVGAIHTGPGLIDGRYSVSPADVLSVLCLPELSVATAADRLLNHDREPMSERQIQRVVEAARIAIGGIALYLERNPDILELTSREIDFDAFWKKKAPDHVENPAQFEEYLGGVLVKLLADTKVVTLATVYRLLGQDSVGLSDAKVTKLLREVGCVQKRSATSRYYITPYGIECGLSGATPPKQLMQLLEVA